MEHRKTSNKSANTFEYTLPVSEDAEDDDVESNKSTPYYTPLEFFQSSFEFPSPKPFATPAPVTPQFQQEENTENLATQNLDSLEMLKKAPTMTTTTSASRQFTPPAVVKQSQAATSPAVNRKIRRFSLYERRSCSPQRLLTKGGAGSVDMVGLDTPTNPSPVDDKENTKPPLFFDQVNDETIKLLAKSGNSSPITFIDECGSPKILTSEGAARHNFSPKLLASINSLKLANSPLGVISSAGYKSGNYFKFPEIDHVVQEHAVMLDAAQEVITEAASPSANGDNQARCIHKQSVYGSQAAQSKLRHLSASLDSGAVKPITTAKETSAQIESEFASDINIKDCSYDNTTTKNSAPTRSINSGRSDSVRKNRKNKNNLTIKITDEQAAAADAEAEASASIPSPSAKPKTPTIKTTKEKALSLDSAACETSLSIKIQPVESGPTHASCDEIDSKVNLSASGTSRQRQMGSRERLRPQLSATSSKQSVCSSSNSPAVYRSMHKPSPLLHASNTNLKTLPEFLTLVEFSTSSPKERDQYPYKQKSMDLPSSSGAIATAATPVLRTKNTAAQPGSLLQRRGSNHSLTLNLHGSCSNLLGSCRTGLSVSNYSLGSAANSATNLNPKPCCTLDPAASQNIAPAEIAGATLQPNVHLTSQGAKQSLFRRRGSNQSLSLRNATATSCGNLNSFASQNSLNVDRAHVTRTTSFITPTHNTMTSNAQTPKRGLLERRGSNQSLTLNMSSSFGGIGTHNTYGASQLYLPDDVANQQQQQNDQVIAAPIEKVNFPPCCVQHHRKFFSSENLNKANAQFSELNDTHRINASRPFGSASDLKPSKLTTILSPWQPAAGRTGELHFDFDENAACTCTGKRNIMTRPLSPQRKAEEFKTYLANIQMLQNASNALNQQDLIKLNYIFDNSYAPNSKSLTDVLPILGVEPSSSSSNNKETGTPTGSSGGSSGLLTTSEDCEVVTRYEVAVKSVLDTLQLEVDEQKRIFRELHKEFWDLPLNHQEKPLVFGSQPKNRYKTILPNETTRVTLQRETTQAEEAENMQGADAAKATNASILALPETGETIEKISSNLSNKKLLIASAETPYINANYIKGPDTTSFSYVATQGPLPNTIFDFWLMVFQNVRNQKTESAEYPFLKAGTPHVQYYQKIVMLTNFLEHHRQKCAVYFPVDLNEVFIATSKQEDVPDSSALIAFFDKYLKSYETEIACGEDGIETFSLYELNEQVNACLPRTGNFFLLKNIGIVRKNGFSIRKIIVLYCLNMAAADTTDSQRIKDISYKETTSKPQLIVRKFACYHYWYPDWPDHRSPRDINTLLDMCLHILNLGKCEAEFDDCNAAPLPLSHITAQKIELYQQDIFNALQPLPIIHCSAGVGRTGCLTAILNGVRQLRQSLAYSLTSMAAAVSKNTTSNINQPLSPVDFRLPSAYLDACAEKCDEIEQQFDNDTDSSFTRNTLYYIRYIVQRQHPVGDHQLSTSSRHQLPRLTDLPKMPDIFVDILGIVCNLRLSRGGMVQNSEQYELIHRAICLYLKRTFALKRF